MCTCVPVYMLHRRMQEQVWCKHAFVETRSWHWMSTLASLLLSFWDKGSTWIWNSLKQWVWLASKPQGLKAPPLTWLVGTGNVSSSLHVCVAKDFPSWTVHLAICIFSRSFSSTHVTHIAEAPPLGIPQPLLDCLTQALCFHGTATS